MRPASIASSLTPVLVALSMPVFALAGLGCASSPPRAASPPGETTTTSASPATPAPAESTAAAGEDQAVMCDLVCEEAKIVPRSTDEPDYTAAATDNANQVLRSMHDDLLACYTTRLAVNPRAHGFITVDILVAPDGKVRDVQTTGGAVLGDKTMSCIVHRIKQATFAPPHGGGTLHIQAPFSLRQVGPTDETL